MKKSIVKSKVRESLKIHDVHQSEVKDSKSHLKIDDALPCATEKDNIFPWYSPYVIFAVTLVIRVYYVSQPRNWWILHPDEVYQSLEVAHSEVYGYGFRPYEYLTSTPNENTTRLRQREISLGMSAMRSFIYPSFFIAITWVAELFTQGIKPFLLWKVSHGVVTSFLPLTIYKFSTDLFNSRDIGVLSSFLVATSVHLNVFGTHTLVNSFLAPFVFLTSSLILNAFSTSKIKDSEQKMVSKGLPGEFKDINDICSPVAETTNNSNVTILGKRLTFNIESLLPNFSKFQSMSKNCEILPNGILGLKRVNEIAPQVVQISYHVPIDAFWNSWKSINHHLMVTISSFVLTTSCYTRPDVTLFSVTVLVPFISVESVAASNIIEILVGMTSATAMCVWLDFRMFGFGIITPWNWFYFNVLTDYSSTFFGKMSISFYTNAMFTQSYFNSILLVLAVILLVYMKATCAFRNCETVMKLFLSFCILLVIYSLQSHKETRHIHNLFCLFYILVSWTFIRFFKTVLSLKASRAMIFFVCILSLFNCIQIFPSPKDQTNVSWTYAHTSDSNDVNSCLDYVGSADDVTGVFMDRSMHMSGGYAILHRNIPILALMINEFNEFDHMSRTTIASSVSWASKDVHVSTFSRASNFISVSNAPYLLKYLIENPHYNYLILKVNRRFITYGYVEIFRSGQMKVLKRNSKPGDEKRLQETADKITIGLNATVLNHEGNMLFDLGCEDKAIERLEESRKIDPFFINNYQLLSNLYFLKGKRPNLLCKHALKKLIKIHV
ncbi:hypothetical protein LOTGIDRAFT_168569 [Lottia gigantea]|uniref:Mannosyltransferase n=1 Tax=Lottia gigantea TaxID=225164 RepID=V3ZQB9_LOTGI|nr:hypothetical protein LOTGIDRAFT_168569 [Lottia gigantea]ESO84700.1 hypothetical protein LOTGIDRAFT_168569 [Lottia gigantea]